MATRHGKRSASRHCERSELIANPDNKQNQQSNMVTQRSHDTGYKLLFSHARVVEDLLRGFVGEDWVEGLDYTTLEKVSGSYISDDLRDREDDIIWRVRHQGAWLYIYLLLEFQSTVDPWMALRIMVYTGLLYQDLIKSGEIKAGEKLPSVFPLVLYNGRKRWTAARDIGELIEQPPGGLRRYHPSQRYFLVEENAVKPEQIDADNTVGTIIRLETSELPEDIRQAVSSLQQRLRQPEYANLRRAFVVWINRIVLRRLMPGQVIPEVNELQEIDTMLAERVEEWTAQWKREGKIEGKLEGKLEGETALLERLITRRFGPPIADTQARLKAATLEQLEQWADNILDAATLEDVFKSH
jgi:predicted transposase YdaD